eukprot:3237093-Prymnesium_polylepis.1
MLPPSLASRLLRSQSSHLRSHLRAPARSLHAAASATRVGLKPPPRAARSAPLDPPAVPRRRVVRYLGRLLLASSNSVSNGRSRRHRQPL